MTQGSLIEFKSFMNDFWNTYRYSEAAVHSSRVGIGRLYDKEKEMDAYQLSHPEYDSLTQPIGDFIPEIQSLLNYAHPLKFKLNFLNVFDVRSTETARIVSRSTWKRCWT